MIAFTAVPPPYQKLGHERDTETRKSVRYACLVAQTTTQKSHEEEIENLVHAHSLVDGNLTKETFISGGVEVLGF
jgi:hypothetical protein